jgi:hypothetical protein
LPKFFASVFLLDFFAHKIWYFLWQMAFGKWHLANGAQICRISAHKFDLNFVGVIEWQIFRQRLRTGDFSLGKQSLVKLTPGLLVVSNWIMFRIDSLGLIPG